MKKHYYDFMYFFSTKDSGSIHVITDTQLDIDSIEDCVEYAIKHHLIDKMYAQNIINVDELTRTEAIERGFEKQERLRLPIC